MSTGSSQLALVHNEIFGADRFAPEIGFQDLARASSVARLRRQRAARDVRRHAMVRHGAPRMVLCWRLRKPNVTRIAGELTALQGPHHRIAVDNLGSGGIHNVAASLHYADQ